MNKKDLRSIYLEKRLSLLPNEYKVRSEKIVSHFFDFVDLKRIKTIHVFLPMVKYNEFNTWEIIDRIRKEWTSIRFSIPKVNTHTHQLDNFYFETKEQLRENKWGISEPQFGDITNPSDIDLVIVPLLTIDKSGHRVGYGKGYYDKLLSVCKPACQKIGVSLFEPIEKIEDVNKLDIALDFCVTSEAVLKF